MNRPNSFAVLLVGATVAFSQAGCRQTAKVAPVSQTAKPGDAPVWTDKELTREDGEAPEAKAKATLGKSSALSGTWSSEGREIEKSLGIGR